MIFEVIFSILVCFAAVPVVVFALEIILSAIDLKGGFSETPDRPSQPRIAVLVPAHNEEVVISKTLMQISNQLSDSGELIVVLTISLK